jgi:hypothetical protein
VVTIIGLKKSNKIMADLVSKPDEEDLADITLGRLDTE